MFKKLIMFIYDSEINCRFEWFWDSGFTWCLLDNSFPRILKDDEFDDNVKITNRTEEDFIKSNNRSHEKDWIARGSDQDIDQAFCDLCDAIIKHLPNSDAAKKLKDYEENMEHFGICIGCGDLFDMRDLGDVFSHEHDKDIPVIDKTKSIISQKIGDPVAWKDGKPINLN